MRKLSLCFLLLSIFSLNVLAQKQPPSPKLQTPRQALIEMISKGGELNIWLNTHGFDPSPSM